MVKEAMEIVIGHKTIQVTNRKEITVNKLLITATTMFSEQFLDICDHDIKANNNKNNVSNNENNVDNNENN